MAKHHWSKKAVLASLMLGASVLVTSTGVQAEEEKTFKSYLSEEFNKQAFDLTEEAAKLQGKDLNEIISKIREVLSHLNTNDLMKLVTHEFTSDPSTTPELIQKIFNFSDDYRDQAKEIFRFVVNDKIGETPIHPKEPDKYGLGQLGVGLATGSRPEDKLSEEELFYLLLTKELFRRSENYEELIKGLKETDTALATTSKQLTEKAEKAKELEEKLTKASEDGQKLKAESEKLATQLKSSQETNSNLQTKMKDLETQAQKATEEANALHEQVTEANNTNQNLQAQLDSKQKDLNDLQQQLTSDKQLSEEEKAKLQSELDAKKTEVTNLQAQVTASTEKLQALEAAKKEADAKVAELTAQKADIEAKLNSQTELSEEEKAKLKEQLADVQAKIAEKDASIKSLEGQLDTLKQQEQEKTPETKPQAPHAPEAGKPGTPEKPEIKPAPTPAIPEKPSKPHTPEKPGKAHPAAPKAHHTVTPAAPHMAAQNTAAHLPQTGDAATNPFFTVAALSVIASAGVLAAKRKED
ncbi:LPXTG cell wall anchor domain-containing protein [Streptococcus halichoeri]|uniref:LPXTG cell wall anchor domain-containing protein n=1 Tax=Streptococcus halichoeri TaxID=254785 RepID=UPI0013573304|nr:LPXTG cell wall anchor domain-containing protein [Streptococcus halichoeri]